MASEPVASEWTLYDSDPADSSRVLLGRRVDRGVNIRLLLPDIQTLWISLSSVEALQSRVTLQCNKVPLDCW